MDDYNWWDKFILHPKMNWLRWFIYNLPDVPMDTYRNIKWFIQRGKRGYSDCDVWGFDYYLSEVIVKGLKDLKKQVHGTPCGTMNVQAISVEDKETGDMKEWKRTIGEIIWTFEATQHIQEHKWAHVPLKKDRDKKSWIDFAKKTKTHIMTKEECERYKNGWTLFQKYYFDLWD